MPGIELPRNLVCDIEGDGSARAERRAWLAGLPAVIEGLARRWSLTVGRPFQPGGSASWVGPVRDRSGQHLVLKVGWPHDEARHEAEGLRLWDGNGTVRLLAAEVTGEVCALLLEACEPGNPLLHALPPLEQDTVAAGLLRRLWIDPPPPGPFRPLADMCDRWAAEFRAKYAAARRRERPRLDPGLARAGIDLFRSLPRTAGRSVLLCTDLHPENILAAKREPWLVVDPKPYLGDPAYDTLQYMLNFPDRLSADPAGFAGRMAGLLGLDAGRVRQWLFARCVQESADYPELCDVAAKLAP